MSGPLRSDMPLASAERLCASGLTNDELCGRLRKIGSDIARQNILVVALNDPSLTMSQHDRAVKLMWELYGSGLTKVDPGENRR